MVPAKHQFVRRWEKIFHHAYFAKRLIRICDFVFHNAEPLSCELDQELCDMVHLNSESGTLDRRAIVDFDQGFGWDSQALVQSPDHL